MQAGDLVAGRFRIDGLETVGLNSQVYRASDLSDGQRPVAIKVVPGTTPGKRERFGREAQALSELTHAAIVRYLAHGTTPDGTLYLAMEWLEGEDLGKRLARGPLSILESLALARRVASALAVAHARGIVHRDIKPSNLHLPGGAIDQVKVLDFGLARLERGAAGATRPGAVLGTPGYMSPEQARGTKKIDARSDVFALGCVLYQCLAGVPPFTGEHPLALLGKILLEEPPSLAERRPDVPAEVEALVVRMLAKNPDDRIADGGALAEEIAPLLTPRVERAPRSAPPEALTRGERRWVSVVLARRAEGIVPKVDEDDVTLSDDSVPALAVELARDTAAYGGRLERLADGSVVITLAGAAAATDQAAYAARCALAVRARVPDAAIAIATGRTEGGARLPVGEVLERATSLVNRVAKRKNGGPSPIPVDDVTAGLLDVGFEVGGDESGLVLRGEREVVETTRTLLGKSYPCVGREREIALLEGVFAECVSEPVSRAVLITGAPGVGKSRLRHELLRRLRERGEGPQVWMARGDALRAGSPYGMIAPFLRRTAGILDGEALAVRQQKLRARVGRSVRSDDATRVAELVGELIGTSFEDPQSPAVRAARKDAVRMAELVRGAFEELLRSETEIQPVAIVLEDLQWGDLASVKLIDLALRNLRDRPWLVIAVARPEVHELFPQLWGERSVIEVRVAELTKKASEKLVRSVLGERLPPAVVARLVDRAAGNAFYLEELIRAEAEGKTSLPETVLAMIQGRLDALGAEARRVLRAASVFGSVFWEGAVGALLGGSQTHRAERVRDCLAELVDRELVARLGAGKFPDEEEYIFRHDAVREAAYAMLTEADRELGHRLAGEWLAQHGESDSAVIGEHCERGREAARAIHWYTRAAEQARARGDLAAVVAHADRAVANGATGGALAALRWMQAESLRWQGDYVKTEQHALAAWRELPPGSERWYSVAGELAVVSGLCGHLDRLVAVCESLRDVQGDAPIAARVIALARAAVWLFSHGRYGLAQELVARIDALAADFALDAEVHARVQYVRAARALSSGDPWSYRELSLAAAASFDSAGNRASALLQHMHGGHADLLLGDYASAVEVLERARIKAEEIGMRNVAAQAMLWLGMALARHGRADEGRRIEASALDLAQVAGATALHFVAKGHIYLALMLLEAGDAEGAEARARRALETAVAIPPVRAHAGAALASALLARGRAEAAHAAAREAMGLIESLGAIEEGEIQVRLAYARTLDATGEPALAVRALATARRVLLGFADRIPDSDRRTRFLEAVPENREVLGLARIRCRDIR